MGFGVIKNLFLGLFFFLVFPVFSHAKMFKWVDENGTIHYTDSSSKIPPNQKTLPPPVKPSAAKTAEEKKDEKDFKEAMEYLINSKGRTSKCANKLSGKIEQCAPKVFE